MKSRGSIILSSRFVVKPEGGQQCIFDVFLTKPVGVNENCGGGEAPEGGLNPPTPRQIEHCALFHDAYHLLSETILP